MPAKKGTSVFNVMASDLNVPEEFPESFVFNGNADEESYKSSLKANILNDELWDASGEGLTSLKGADPTSLAVRVSKTVDANAAGVCQAAFMAHTVDKITTIMYAPMYVPGTVKVTKVFDSTTRMVQWQAMMGDGKKSNSNSLISYDVDEDGVAVCLLQSMVDDFVEEGDMKAIVHQGVICEPLSETKAKITWAAQYKMFFKGPDGDSMHSPTQTP